jgi:hypothetical protein
MRRLVDAAIGGFLPIWIYTVCSANGVKDNTNRAIRTSASPAPRRTVEPEEFEGNLQPATKTTRRSTT